MEFKKEYIPLVIIIIIAVIKICKDTKIIESAKRLTPDKKLKKNYTETITQAFTSNNHIMTNAELSFYHCLKNELSENHSIFTKVRMEDIIQVKPKLQNTFSLRNQIKSKHIDFVICNSKTGEIQRAIELNDSSHNRQDRIKRDLFVEKAFKSAGIKLLIMNYKNKYTRKDIETLFQ